MHSHCVRTFFNICINSSSTTQPYIHTHEFFSIAKLRFFPFQFLQSISFFFSSSCIALLCFLIRLITLKTAKTLKILFRFLSLFFSFCVFFFIVQSPFDIEDTIKFKIAFSQIYHRIVWQREKKKNSAPWTKASKRKKTKIEIEVYIAKKEKSEERN